MDGWLMKRALLAGVVPTMDIMDSSASSNASSQDFSAVAESPNSQAKMGSYSTSQEQVSDCCMTPPLLHCSPHVNT